MSEKTDVNALRLRLAHMQTLQSRLPHIFGNQACITSIEITCPHCHEIVAGKNVLAEIIASTNCLAVTAYAVCYPCQLIVPMDARYAADGSVLYRGKNDYWHSATWRSQQQIFRILFQKFRNIFHT